MMSPLVSVITPCYNSAKTIEKTLDSMANQTYQKFEYIIIDGASTDDTIRIIRKYSNMFGDKLRIISEPDKGIYDAMNKGILAANGKLIGIVNSDDYYERDAIEVMVSAYDEGKNQILYGFQRFLNNGREISVSVFNHNNLDKQMITHPTCFVAKSVYDTIGLFDTKYRSSADYEFMLRAYHSNRIEFKEIYHIISNFEMGGMSSTQPAVRETLSLRLKYGVISKKQYNLLILKSHLAEFKYRLLKNKNRSKR